MSAFLRKELMYLLRRNSSASFPCKPRFPFSTCFHHLSEPIITNPTVYDFLVHKHHFSPVAATKLASLIPYLKYPEKSDSLLSFLKKHDFSNSHLEKIFIFRPTVIWADLEKSVEPKIKILQQLGLPNNKIADLCTHDANIFYGRVDSTLMPALSVLRGLLGSDASVVKLLMNTRCGWYLSTDLDKYLMPNIDFLKSRSVPMKQIINTMHSHPRILLLNPEKLRRYAQKAEEMGAHPSSGMYIHAVRIINSMSDEVWALKLEALRTLGFSEDDILNTFSKYPTAFAMSVKKMREVRDVLVSSGKYDVASIVYFPMCFASSIEKRLKPRLQVLAALEDKKLIKKWPSLATLCCKTDKHFFSKFVGPYMDEVGHLFVMKGSTLTSGKSMPVS